MVTSSALFLALLALFNKNPLVVARDSWYQIAAADSGDIEKCMTAKHGQSFNGNLIIFSACDAGNPQQQFLLPRSGTGQIRYAVDPTKCLSDPALGDVELWDCGARRKNQEFNLDVAVAQSRISVAPKGRHCMSFANRLFLNSKVTTKRCDNRDDKQLFVFLLPPTAAPTLLPTLAPTSAATFAPTSVPTSTPTSVPTPTPTSFPTAAPTMLPTPTATTCLVTCNSGLLNVDDRDTAYGISCQGGTAFVTFQPSNSRTSFIPELRGVLTCMSSTGVRSQPSMSNSSEFAFQFTCDSDQDLRLSVYPQPQPQPPVRLACEVRIDEEDVPTRCEASEETVGYKITAKKGEFVLSASGSNFEAVVKTRGATVECVEPDQHPSMMDYGLILEFSCPIGIPRLSMKHALLQE